MNLKFKITINIVLAILAVVAFNLIILSFLGFPPMAILQIKKYSLLLIPLVLGFGAQIGLYTYLKHKNMVCSITTATGGGVSSISMLLCCSHYLANILPFISLSSLSFFTNYTLQILLFGLAANLMGILVMVKKLGVWEGKMESKLILYVLVGIVVIWLALVSLNVITWDFKVGGINSGYNNLPEKCRPPAGQDLASWKEHLSHHADTQDCLNYFE